MRKLPLSSGKLCEEDFGRIGEAVTVPPTSG